MNHSEQIVLESEKKEEWIQLDSYIEGNKRTPHEISLKGNPEIQLENGMKQKNIQNGEDEFEQEERQRQRILKKKSSTKKSKIPSMKVTCSQCNTTQSIHATKSTYLCQNCGQKEQNSPIYGLLICKQCQKKVLFMRGVSKTVRCTNCSSMNPLPSAKQAEEEEM